MPNPPLSACMAVINDGTLVYLGHNGERYTVLGGINGQINLSKLS